MILNIYVFSSLSAFGGRLKPFIMRWFSVADKIEYAPDADLLKKMKAQITVVESKKDWKRFNRQRPIVNKSGNRSAYIAQFAIEPGGEALIDVIIVYEKLKDKFYEIRGFDFPRPFDELKWTSDDALEFEQWINPRNGGRYTVNLKSGKSFPQAT